MRPSSQDELLSSDKSYGLSCRVTLAAVDMASPGLLAHVMYRVLLRSYNPRRMYPQRNCVG
jgi:hypothetical protein